MRKRTRIQPAPDPPYQPTPKPIKDTIEPIVLVDNCLPHMGDCMFADCHNNEMLLCVHKIHKNARVFYLEGMQCHYKDHEVIEHFFRLISSHGFNTQGSSRHFIIITRDDDFFEDAKAFQASMKLDISQFPIIFELKDRKVTYGNVTIWILNINNRKLRAPTNKDMVIRVVIERIHDFLALL